MVTTYMTLLVLFVGPVGLGWYLQGFETISEQQLATFTVTSPYSAALSVPMHLYRGSGNYSGDSVQVAAATLVPITPNLGLPVWALFLLIYPPLCVLSYGVTYLAFRVRWWRAGGT
jgi:hypothetical protein